MAASVLRLFAPVEECLHLRHDDHVRDARPGVGERLLDLGAEPCVVGVPREISLRDVSRSSATQV